ncbi:hypothetical protein G9A89_006738 [Geosiphon pyriformis]|nr:hypothetical protein G9A89_006738 [Geosiphon pyriformis]
MHLEKSDATTLKGAQLYGSAELKRLLCGHGTTLQKRLEQCSNIEDFFIDLQDLLERLVTKEKQEPLPPVEFYSTVMAELDSIGWDKLESIDHSFKEIYLKLSDSSGRQHSVNISLPFSYPKSPPIIRVDLPKSISVPPSRNIKFRNVVTYLLTEFEKHQDFWDLVEDFDKHTWILEPERPKRSHTMRRIFIGNHCSLEIYWDVECPRDIVDCRLHGAEKFVASLREKINSKSIQWDKKLTTKENLENILGIEFPSPQNTSKSDFEIECAICYAYRLEDSIPDQSCNNAKCGQSFHQTCLHEWLRSLPTTRQSFNTLFGNCPYCNDSITTSLTDI